MSTRQSAIVTGGAHRIGKSIALRLSEMGYDILLHYRSSGKGAEETRQKILENGVKCRLIQADLSEKKAAASIFGQIPDDWHPEILVNNASIFQASDFHDKGSEKLDLHYHINFRSPYLLTKLFFQNFGEGHIINLLDTKVADHHTDHLDYILTKKLLRDFTLIAAAELGPGVRVNGIAPGLVLPPAGKDEEYLLEKARNIPLQKIGDLEQIGNAVDFLVKNPFITGQIIFVNGGEHL